MKNTRRTGSICPIFHTEKSNCPRFFYGTCVIACREAASIRADIAAQQKEDMKTKTNHRGVRALVDRIRKTSEIKFVGRAKFSETYSAACATVERFVARKRAKLGATNMKLSLKPSGDCWLHIDAPSGNKASINLGQRGDFNDQTLVGNVIREVAELCRD